MLTAVSPHVLWLIIPFSCLLRTKSGENNFIYSLFFNSPLIEKTEENVANAIKRLERREDILFAGPNYVYSIASTHPNDTHYQHGDQWGLNGTKGINAPEAWDITSGSSTITVGVMDTGIQGNHPDLVNRISTAGWHRDCTGNPILPVTNANLTDPDGHGTHVAGIIGAEANNPTSTGIAGVCWNIKLVSLRVFDATGNGNAAMQARAVNFAASVNIPILNFSGGGTANDTSLRSAISNYTGLFVCAAGNGGTNNDTSPVYPSEYSRGQTFSDRVISVGAINIAGNRSSFSNFGLQSVSLFAPGESILSTYPQGFCTGLTRVTQWGTLFECETEWGGAAGWIRNFRWHHADGYHELSGTSMAAPHVAGVAALLLSKYPSYTAAQLKQEIMSSVTTSPNHSSECVSGGRLNAVGALKGRLLTVNGSYITASGGNTYYATGDTVTIHALGSFTKPGYDFANWTVNAGGITLANASNPTTTFTMQSAAVTVTANWKPKVTINDSYASTTGAGAYTSGALVTINAGTRSGYVFNGWVITSGYAALSDHSNPTTTFTMPSTPITIKATWIQTGTPGWITYAENNFYPQDSGSIYRVAYELQYYKSGNVQYHNTYAYFDNDYDAINFVDTWWFFQPQYMTTYDGGTLYYLVPNWTIEYYDNGNWYTWWKK